MQIDKEEENGRAFRGSGVNSLNFEFLAGTGTEEASEISLTHRFPPGECFGYDLFRFNLLHIATYSNLLYS